MASFRGNNSIWERYHPEHDHLMVNQVIGEKNTLFQCLASACEVDCEANRRHE